MKTLWMNCNWRAMISPNFFCKARNLLYLLGYPKVNIYTIYIIQSLRYTCALYYILPTKTTAALSYHRVRGLYFLAVVFAATIVGNWYTAVIGIHIISFLEVLF